MLTNGNFLSKLQDMELKKQITNFIDKSREFNEDTNKHLKK